VSAPVWKRIAEPTLQYLGVGPTLNPTPPVLVARRDDPAAAAADEPPPESVIRLIADDLPGTVPDVRGMSARAAVQKLVKVGLIARISGDGVVVAQEPAGGTALERGRVCRLILDRSPAHGTPDAAQP
jgi:PASTA domain